MKFLQVYCETRKTVVYIQLDKIIMVSVTETKEGELAAAIEMQGLTDNYGAVVVRKSAEELIRMI
ncbi:MAG TPA: hypothetical protein VHK91_12535, partial [Flavisolibacter sp.]|nr:hypothetical protein [Flavisolibacter sp.]